MQAPTQQPPSSPRVVLLDGYEETRDATANELRRSGFDVIAVEEEDEAIAVVTRPSRRGAVDIVVLDIPLAEAQEAARALTSIAPSARRPPPTIVALASPSDRRATREAAHASGVDYVLLRPCPPEALTKHLRRLLRPPRAFPAPQRR